MILYKKEVRNNTMKKTDIMQENLCIQKIITVIQGKNEKHHKLLTVQSRHSDAFVYVRSGSCTYRFDDKTEFKVTAVFSASGRAVIARGNDHVVFNDNGTVATAKTGTSFGNGLCDIKVIIVL